MIVADETEFLLPRLWVDDDHKEDLRAPPAPVADAAAVLVAAVVADVVFVVFVVVAGRRKRNRLPR